MSCNDGSISNAPLSPVPVVQGSDVNFTIRLKDVTTGDPLDLTSCTSASMSLPNADGTDLNLTLGMGITIVSPTQIGKLTVSLSAAQTLLLNTGVSSFVLTLVISTKTAAVLFQSAINVTNASS